MKTAITVPVREIFHGNNGQYYVRERSFRWKRISRDFPSKSTAYAHLGRLTEKAIKEEL